MHKVAVSGSGYIWGTCTLIGMLAGVVVVTVATGGSALAFIGPAMTLTAPGALVGVGAGGMVGLVAGGLAALDPDEILADTAARLEIELTDEIKLDIVRILAGAATCGTDGPVRDAKRNVVLREAFGLSAAAVPDALRKRVDAILLSNGNIEVVAALRRLARFGLLKHAIYYGCVRVMAAGVPPQQVAMERFLGMLKAEGYTPPE